MASSAPYISAFTAALTLLAYISYRRFAKKEVNIVPGPPNPSWMHGNLLQYLADVTTSFDWESKYGKVVKAQGPFGQNSLLVSDPKAIQYMFQTRAYHFPKHRERKAVSHAAMGSGLVWVEGQDHKRQRKVMSPGFGIHESRELLPVFRNSASHMVSKWHELLANNGDESVVVDIPSWTSRATLDAIGMAAFDYSFGALDDADNALSKAYQNLFFDTFSRLSNGVITFMTLSQFMPDWLLYWVAESSPVKRVQHMKETAKLSTAVAKRLVNEKRDILLQGRDGSKDIMSLAVKANVSQDTRAQLREEEMLAQLRTMILAGHETTSNSLSWIFLELCKNPDIQTCLRTEIRRMEQEKAMNGGGEWEAKDFETMPYLTAVVKESLRYHPVAYMIHREAADNDVLPLSEPMLTTDGRTITELPIPKGIKIAISIAAYNRNKNIFGEDADQFNPDRWLQELNKNKATSTGVYSNMMTFSTGVRSCIGWRFAVLEIHAFVVEMISHFEFSLAVEAESVCREAAGVMLPTIKGQREKGSQLPVRIRAAPKAED